MTIAKLTNLLSFDLCSAFKAYPPIPGGPIVTLTNLVTKLSHISVLNIDLEEIILAPKTLEELSEIAYSNKQKLTIKTSDYIYVHSFLFEMELNVVEN